MKKVLLTGLIIFVVLAVIVSIIGLFYLGPIVKMGIEKFGPEITKVPVTVESVNVSILSGSASVKGLVVGNPQGFPSPHAIKVGNMSVRLEPLSVLSDKIVIHSIRVDEPEITFEGSLGGSNLSKILHTVNSSASDSRAAENAPAAPKAANDKPAPKIHIDDFLITKARVKVGVAALAGGSVSLPDIHLKNLGKGSNGLTPVEVTRSILNAVLKSTIKVVASAPKIVASAPKAVLNTVEDIGGTIKGLFK